MQMRTRKSPPSLCLLKVALEHATDDDISVEVYGNDKDRKSEQDEGIVPPEEASEDSLAGYQEMDEEAEDMDDSDMEYNDFDDAETPAKPSKRKAKQPLGTGTVLRGKRLEKIPMECKHCGMYLMGKSNLNSHISRVHLKHKPHKCKICGIDFWANAALENHTLTVHTRKCEHCQSFVVESTPWSEGMDKRSKRNVLCSCGQVVSVFTAYGRRRTANFNEDDGPPMTEDGFYACRSCDQLFNKKAQCVKHESTHTGKINICNICNEQFPYESSYSKHMEDVHNMVMFKCKLCKKKYSSEISLKVHLSRGHKTEIANTSAIEKIGKIEAEVDLPQFRLTNNASEDAEMAEIAIPSDAAENLEPGQTVIGQVEDGVVFVSTRDPEMTNEMAQDYVNQAIKEGHITVPNPDEPMTIALNVIP